MPLIDLSADLGPNTEPMMAQLDDDPLPPGTSLGGCQILEPLSSDGMSILYLADDATLQRHVLIREHYPSALVVRGTDGLVQLKEGANPAARAHALEAFLQEGRLLVRLDHPSIAKVHRLWEHNHTAYMMMPFYQGDTLAEVLHRMDGPPSEAWLRQMLASLLGALKTLHAGQCYHQALAPDTIWMTPEGRPMLLDLSACSQVAGERGPGEADSVDRLYAPIELFSHGRDFAIGPWTDLYAVGAVVHHALLGRPPTSAAILGPEDRLAPLAESLLAQSPRHATLAYGPGFLAAIDRALSVDPSDRPQSVDEFEAALNLAGDSHLAGVGAGTASSATVTQVPPHPGPDGRPHDEAADPAAAAAIAMAIASLPWGDRQETTAATDEPSLHQVLLHEDEHRPHPKAGPASAGPREPVFGLPSASAPHDEQMWIDPPRPGARTAAATAPARGAAARRSLGQWATAAVLVAGVASLAWYARDNTSQWEQWVARLTSSKPVQPAAVHPPADAVALAPAVTPVPAAASAPPPSASAATTATPAVAADVVASIDNSKSAAAGTSSDTPAPPAATASEATPDAATAAKLGAGRPAADERPAAASEARPPAATRHAIASAAHKKPKSAAVAAFDPESLPPTSAGPSTPRATCGNRTNFALVYCMQTQCKRPVFAKHAQCVAFHRDGEVQ